MGIADSKRLGLVRVNFGMVDCSVKWFIMLHLTHIESQIKSEYPELFKDIGLMDGEISIKLRDGAIPYVKPVRCIPYAMQESLKNELDKLVNEKYYTR